MNEFDCNPYIELNARCNDLNARRKQIEAETYKFHDEFLKVFAPDQTQFDSLKDQAKQMLIVKRPQEEIDKIYYKMAMIYKRWLPIQEYLYEKNPLYRDLFKGLSFMLKDIEKREHGKAKAEDEIPQPKRKRRDGASSKKGNGNKRASRAIRT